MSSRASAVAFGALAVASLIATSSAAADVSKTEAERRVSGMEAEHASFLAKFPAMAEIDGAIRGDCAQKVTGHASEDAFCRSASAVTVSLWRSGLDPKMIGRLQDYLNGSGTLKPHDFLQFQGPELYQPLCDRGAGK